MFGKVRELCSKAKCLMLLILLLKILQWVSVRSINHRMENFRDTEYYQNFPTKSMLDYTLVLMRVVARLVQVYVKETIYGISKRDCGSSKIMVHWFLK